MAAGESLRNVVAQARREMNAVFLSTLGYAVLTLFLLFSGLFFYLITRSTGEADFSGTIGAIGFQLLVATPLLTMRLLSEEIRSGTIESLLTAPVTDGQIVMGKYLGALGFLLFMLAPTALYVAILGSLGEPDYGLILSSYVGLALMAAQFAAVGLFCSALTKNQIVAGVTALVVLLALWLFGAAAQRSHGALGSAAAYAGVLEHVRPFWMGRVAFRDVVYFLSTTAFCLFLSVRVLESKRWR
jgi:ABC-2 type transport system permease protein